jgi:hypothetical protein
LRVEAQTMKEPQRAALSLKLARSLEALAEARERAQQDRPNDDQR